MARLPILLTQVASLLGSGSWLSVRHSCTQLYEPTLPASVGIIPLGAAGLCDQVWFHGSTTAIIQDNGVGYNRLPLTSAVGHDTAAAMVRLPILLTQVASLLGSGLWLSVCHSCTQLYGPTLPASVGIIPLGAAGLWD
ncbi:hypothetical protein MTO96_045303 [Rhipicephalus appendiculatus]